MKAKIIGTGSYLPEKIVYNSDFEKMVETSDEWIKTRTGIEERRISTGETTCDMAKFAALKALEDSKTKPEEIDLIITSTSTQDYFFPSTSCVVQGQIGADNAFCFDLGSAACSGFVYAMNVVTQFIENGSIKKALVICSEVLSKIVDYTDRTTCVIFGDGAAAVVVEASDEGGVLANFALSEGKSAALTVVKTIDFESPFVENKSEIFPKANSHYMYMDGKEIYKFAVRVIPIAIEEVLKKTDLNISDIKYIIPHQANKRIIDYVADKFKIDMEKVVINIDKYGNTSSASIPLCIDELNKKGLLKRGDKIITVGFGGGLTYGANLIEW